MQQTVSNRLIKKKHFLNRNLSETFMKRKG